MEFSKFTKRIVGAQRGALLLSWILLGLLGDNPIPAVGVFTTQTMVRFSPRV